MRELVELDELYPLIAEVIGKGGEFRFYPRGTSMEPLLYEGRDSVVLGAADEISVGDVLLYRRKNGQFVMHRLILKRGDTLSMCGDHQFEIEHGIMPSQVLAKMIGYYKGESYHSLDEKVYLDYTKRMVNKLPFYRKSPYLLSFLRKAKRIFK